MKRPDPAGQPASASLSKEALEALRQRVEQRRHLVTHSVPADMPLEVQRLVQELQVHQIELEMQYEELLLAQLEADKSRAQYIDLYEFAPVGYCTVAADGVVQQLNLRAGQLLGATRQELLGRRLALFVEMNSRAQFADFLQLVLTTEHRHTLTLPLRRTDNSLFYTRLEGQAADTLVGPHCRLALFDVTEQHQAQQALAVSEKRFRTLFEHNQDGMLLLRDNRFVDCNPSALRLLGLPDKQALLGQHASAFSPEMQPNGLRSYPLANQYWEEAMQKGYCQFEWCRHRVGKEDFWEEILYTVIPEEDGTRTMHAAWRDITDRKRAEAERATQQQRLADAVLSAQEAEKSRIAESLHNGLGQFLYAAKLHLAHIQLPASDQATREAKEKVTQMLSSAITQARTLSHQLVPTTLEDFGLEAALKDICHICGGPQLQFSCYVQPLPVVVPKNLQVAVFRMAQELANNIVKHANATKAQLRLHEQHGYLLLQAQDNGRGFEAQPNSDAGLGLSAMHDRVRLLSGTIDIRSAARRGTTIAISLPLEPGKHPPQSISPTK